MLTLRKLNDKVHGCKFQVEADLKNQLTPHAQASSDYGTDIYFAPVRRAS